MKAENSACFSVRRENYLFSSDIKGFLLFFKSSIYVIQFHCFWVWLHWVPTLPTVQLKSYTDALQSHSEACRNISQPHILYHLLWTMAIFNVQCTDFFFFCVYPSCGCVIAFLQCETLVLFKVTVWMSYSAVDILFF